MDNYKRGGEISPLFCVYRGEFMADMHKVGRKNKKNGKLAEISALRQLAKYGFRLTVSSGSGEDEKGDLVNNKWMIEVKTRQIEERKKDGTKYCRVDINWLTKAIEDAKKMELNPCLFYRPRGYSKFIVFIRKQDFDYIGVEHGDSNRIYRQKYHYLLDMFVYKEIVNNNMIYITDNDYYIMNIERFISLCNIEERPTLLPLYKNDDYIIDINTGRVLDMKTGKFLNVSLDEKGAYVYIRKQKRYIGTLIVTAYCNRPISGFNIIKWESAGTSINDIYFELKTKTERRAYDTLPNGDFNVRNIYIRYDIENRIMPKDYLEKVFDKYGNEIFSVTIGTEPRELVDKTRTNRGSVLYGVYAGEKWKPNDGKMVIHRVGIFESPRGIRAVETRWAEVFNSVLDCIRHDSWVCLRMKIKGENKHLWFSSEENIREAINKLQGA